MVLYVSQARSKFERDRKKYCFYSFAKKLIFNTYVFRMEAWLKIKIFFKKTAVNKRSSEYFD